MSSLGGTCHFSPTASTRSPRRAGRCESCPSPWAFEGLQHILWPSCTMKDSSVRLLGWLQEGSSEAVSGLSLNPSLWVSSNRLLGVQYKLCPFIWRKGRAGPCCITGGARSGVDHRETNFLQLPRLFGKQEQSQGLDLSRSLLLQGQRCLDSSSKALKPHALKRSLLKTRPSWVLSQLN